ncbi:MAG: DUF2066 domain-containing protein [Zavarzinia sp.]|nr:DUF2066 domain-containing protein [Zavarzinia sp.]
MSARPVEGLTNCETVVTGQEATERARGLGLCLAEVLVRVSGRPALAADPRVEALKPQASAALLDLEYEDRMKALPLGDEQGTRDRPFFLRPRFRPDAIEGMLAELGVALWPADRPVVGVLVTVQREERRWLVAPGVAGVTANAQIEALRAAGDRFGVPLALPAPGVVSPDGDGVPEPPADFAARLGADAVLAGHLVWDEAALGWRVTWVMPGRDVAPWSAVGVSFDDAFRLGVGGVAAALSGNVQAP